MDSHHNRKSDVLSYRQILLENPENSPEYEGCTQQGAANGQCKQGVQRIMVK